MRCYCCGTFSLRIFCSLCRSILGSPTVGVRRLEPSLKDSFNVYYFYNYSEIKPLILSKHKMVGGFVFGALAKLAFRDFKQNFNLPFNVDLIAMDDDISSGYSHTALLCKELKGRNFKPLYNALKATSGVKYSGKSLEFRLANPRNFKLLKQPKNPVIIVDDIITTGTSMIEARDVLKKSGATVLFGIVLADARY